MKYALMSFLSFSTFEFPPAQVSIGVSPILVVNIRHFWLVSQRPVVIFADPTARNLPRILDN